jgi:hypothetical protein
MYPRDIESNFGSSGKPSHNSKINDIHMYMVNNTPRTKNRLGFSDTRPRKSHKHFFLGGV